MWSYHLVFKVDLFLEPKDKMKNMFPTYISTCKNIFRSFGLDILLKCKTENVLATFLYFQF